MEDWNAIISKAEAERFVGREQELELFQREIALPVPRVLIYYLTGQGGAGKTTLLRRYQELARSNSFLVAECSEQQRDVPAVLGRFAQQLAEQHAPLENFEKRYKVYRSHLREIENDPDAPQGLAAFLGRTVVRAAYTLGDGLPVVRKGLEYLPQETVETQVSDWVSYLAKRMSNKDEVALMRDPIATLTPLFFEDLNRLAPKQSILLCFDNFEATRPELQGWLLHLSEYHPLGHIRLAIAGREPLVAAWDPLRRVTKAISLDVFSEEEAELFLDAYGILDQRRRAEILQWSGRLPVLMSWLATPQGEEPDPSVPLHDIVERFLRWVTEPAKREIALLVAFPRTFNLDMTRMLMEQKRYLLSEQEAFDWLQSMPFVQSRAGGWQYHPVVRRMMLHYQRQTSPQHYADEQKHLAEWYQARYQKLQSEAGEQWTNEQWCKDLLEYVYHHLAADPLTHWKKSIEWFVFAMRKRRTFAGEIIEMLRSDEVQGELQPEQCKITQLLYEQSQKIKEGSLKDGLAMFEHLCATENLSTRAKGYAFSFRGESYRQMEKMAEALADFDCAIALNEKDAWTLGCRGQTYGQMGKYAEALDNLDQAIALDKKSSGRHLNRGGLYLMIGKYQEALSDFERAVALGAKSALVFVCRGWAYFSMGRYPEALTDLDRAVSLDKKFALALASRGGTYYRMGKYGEALVDLDQAIVLDENDTRALAYRGATYHSMDRYQEALADFNRMIALDKESAWALANRGQTYRLMGRYDEALTDFDQAITLNEKYTWVFAERGETYRLTSNYEEALTNFDRAIALDENYAWALAHRGMTYCLMGQYTEALANLNQAIAVDERNDWYRYNRAQVHYLLHNEDAFQQDMEVAINLEKQAYFPSADPFIRWKRDFNLALFALFLRSDLDAQLTFTQLIAACPFVLNLQDAIDDLKDLLTIQPQNELIPPLQQQLRARIQEIKQTSVEQV